MGWRIVVIVLSCVCTAYCSVAEPVTVTVEGVTSIANTDQNFICATLDWWPEDKCDYGQCPWGKAGILNLDLNNKILINAIKAFNRLRIRIGGSLQDQVVYNVGNKWKCPHFKKTHAALFGFSHGCLPMDRWDDLNHLFNNTRAQVTFSLNALKGKWRPDSQHSLYVGDWNSRNAHALINYTLSKGYEIDSYELGNELCGGGVAARIGAKEYAKDMIQLRNLVNKLYSDPASQPKVLGPGGFFDQKWFEEYLQAMGPGVIDGVTHHIYNLGAGVDKSLIDKVQNPFYLSEVAQTFKDVSRTVDLFAPSSGAWVGESGGAYNSGGKDVSHTFANGFWYLDQLGMTSTFNHKVYCRQALIGGNYALLNTTTFIPNPDYYGALIWHRVMGTRVLSVSHKGSPYLRVYSHCSKKTPGITLLLINMSNSTTFQVLVVDDLNLYPKEIDLNAPQREEYHLTPEGGNIHSDVLLLNGSPLKLTESLAIPNINPQIVDPYQPINVASDSFVFATLRGFQAPACA